MIRIRLRWVYSYNRGVHYHDWGGVWRVLAYGINYIVDFIIILISFETQLLIDLFILKYYRLQWPINMCNCCYHMRINNLATFVMDLSHLYALYFCFYFNSISITNWSGFIRERSWARTIHAQEDTGLVEDCTFVNRFRCFTRWALAFNFTVIGKLAALYYDGVYFYSMFL